MQKHTGSLPKTYVHAWQCPAPTALCSASIAAGDTDLLCKSPSTESSGVDALNALTSCNTSVVHRSKLYTVCFLAGRQDSHT